MLEKISISTQTAIALILVDPPHIRETFMSIWQKLFGTKKVVQEEDIFSPETIEHLPAADDATFYRDSKRLLQRFDEYITAAESEVEELSIELDNILAQTASIRLNIEKINKEGSWHEKSLLLKLDRLTLHGENLKQRIEIYSQNIKIYLNLISKIQDVKAMRMNGLSEDKIETIWLEFRDTVEQYRERLGTEEAGFDNEPITTQKQELRLKELRNSILPAEQVPAEPEITEKEPTRPPISELMHKVSSDDDSRELELA